MPEPTAVDRLAAALAAIDDIPEADIRDSIITDDDIQRAGAMAGVLLTRVVDVLIGAAGTIGDADRSPSVTAHLAAANAANQLAGEHTAGFVTTAANLLWSVVQYPTFREHHGPLGPAMADHLGAVVDHGLTYLQHGHHDHDGADDGEDHVDQAPAEAETDSAYASVQRLTDACAALGITPLIAVEGAGAPHHAVPVAALAGIITGRVALESASAIEHAPSGLAVSLGPVWSRGLRAGVTTDPTEPASDDMVAGVMMRMVMTLGNWFASEVRTRRSEAVALLLGAAVSAARTDALENASADDLAEYIAHTGADAGTEHAAAIDKAAEAIDYLKRC